MITKLLKEIENGKGWEDAFFNIGCEIAANLANQVFSKIDEGLAEARDKSRLRMIDSKREKTITTRFGTFTLSRRYYKDEKTGESRFLLDEKLGMEKKQTISPRILSLSTLLATMMPFRNSSFTLNQLLPRSASLSHQSIHTALQKEAEEYDQIQKAQTKALFENGEIPPDLKQKEVDNLFVEADGCWIHLQREDKKDAELKLGIAYEGLKKTTKDRYKTVNKTYFSGFYPSTNFWQGFSAKLNFKYSLAKTKKSLMGGDGASWIKDGLSYFINSSFTLDKFHQLQALKKVFGFRSIKVGESLAAIEAKNVDKLFNLLKGEAAANPTKEKEIKKIINYFKKNQACLVKNEEIQGLGAMESNIDKTLANRLKKRGMSWKISGGHNMAKMIELRLSKPLDKLLACYLPEQDKKTKEVIKLITTPIKKDIGGWLKATIPAMNGPHANRPWVKVLKEIAYS